MMEDMFCEDNEWSQTMMEDMFCEDHGWSIQGVEPNYDGRHAQ